MDAEKKVLRIFVELIKKSVFQEDNFDSLAIVVFDIVTHTFIRASNWKQDFQFNTQKNARNR